MLNYLLKCHLKTFAKKAAAGNKKQEGYKSVMTGISIIYGKFADPLDFSVRPDVLGNSDFDR